MGDVSTFSAFKYLIVKEFNIAIKSLKINNLNI